MLDLLTPAVLGLHLLSQHAPEQPWHNNENLGAYVRTEEGWTAGAYRNTLRRTTVYAGYTWLHALAPNADVGLTVGLGTGYQRKTTEAACPEVNRKYHKHYAQGPCTETLGFSRGALTALVVPSVRYEFVRLGFVPRVGEHSSVLHLMVEPPARDWLR